MAFFFDEFRHLKIQLEEIKLATDNFADDKAIGRGGFGKVYRGEISRSKGRSMVAFKRLDSRFGQGNSEFWKEVMMLSRYRHENLVSLLGYCDEGDEKILVYEHASRGSLDRHLSSPILTWMQRLKICLGVARGLNYLHDPSETQQRVIHRDIKSSNILLDESWNAKVSDFGLSKIGPANQAHTAIVSNIVGTPGYLDPLYMEMGLLTKESDVYSFGVVLFEALCGRLCFEYNNHQCQSLVHSWKQSYKQKKLAEIIFQDLVQQMNPSSLETFSDIAYLCLQESREERPSMASVVEKLENALLFQELFELVEMPKEYGEILKSAVIPLNFRSEEELKKLLSRGILIHKGEKWFSVNKNGEHCELISARRCSFGPQIYIEYSSVMNSRFVKECCCRTRNMRFTAHVRARFLSPGITYTVNLVFMDYNNRSYNSKFRYPIEPTIRLEYKLRGETKSSISYLAYQRENEWMAIELYQFTSEGTNIDLYIHFGDNYDLMVEGIEFRPLEKVEHEALGDEKVDMQSTSDLEVDWEQILPNDYKELIKWSKDDGTKSKTTKEIYDILCKGFLIINNDWKSFLLNNDGEEWFFLAKNGKKCRMLPARAVLIKCQWKWKPLPTSRFKKVAFNRSPRFSIICKIKSQILSPRTTYACYLVYKITTKVRYDDLVAPVTVLDLEYGSHNRQLWYIYLLTPLTRVISLKDDQNTYNPTDVPKSFKRLPQLRNDGWMEVQVLEFQTDTTSKMIPINLNFHDHSEMYEALIVQGIEVRPL